MTHLLHSTDLNWFRQYFANDFLNWIINDYRAALKIQLSLMKICHKYFKEFIHVYRCRVGSTVSKCSDGKPNNSDPILTF